MYLFPRSARALLLSSGLTCAFLALTSTPARAAQLTENDEVSIQASGLARVRAVMTPRGDEPGSFRTDLVTASLMGRATYRGVGVVEVELNGTNQGSPLLDLFIDVHMRTPILLRAGFFRTPFSRELLLPLSKLPVHDRTQLSTVFGARRAPGVAAQYTTALHQTVTLNVGSGVYGERADPTQLSLISHVDLRLADTFDVHIAHMKAISGSREERPELDEQLDVALYYERDGLRMLLEAAVALQSTRGGDPYPYGVHGLVAYQLDLTGRQVAIEPALGIDIVHAGEESMSRASGLISALLDDHNLKVGLGFSAGEASERALLTTFQGRF